MMTGLFGPQKTAYNLKFELITNSSCSLRASKVIAGVLGRAGQAGQERRLADAKTGKITWKPPPLLGKPADKEEELRNMNARKLEQITRRKSSWAQASNESYVEPIRDPDWRIKAKVEGDDE